MNARTAGKAGFRMTTVIALVLALAVVLSGCSRSDEPTLYVYNWSDYIDEDLIDEFSEETGIEVVMDFFDSNESMYAKLQAGGGGYDLVVPTTYMVEIMHDSGMLAPIDHEKIPNIGNIDRSFTAMAPDSEMAYSVPYMVSSSGIGYLESITGPMDEVSWSILGDPRFRGRATMLNDARESVGAALKYLGYSYNSTSPEELAEAQELLIEWKANLAKFDNDQYRNGLVSGEFHVVHGYSGDILQGQDENESIIFATPREGTTIAIDNMVIPADSENVDAAHAFIDFMLRPEVAARNIEYVYYLAPNTAAYPLVDEDVRNNPAVFLPEDLLSSAEILLDLGDDNELFNDVWDAVRAAP
jgi:spermidine/putrescine transport system substrate-binding protein